MSLVLLAMALFVLPGSAAGRLKALQGKGRVRFRLSSVRDVQRVWHWVWHRLRAMNQLAAVVLGAVLGLVLGVGGAVAGVLVAMAVWRARRDRRLEQDRLRARTAVAEGLSGFVAELRSGAHPARAAISAAEDAEPPADGILRAIASTAARGGNVETALRDTDARQLARAWRLSSEHGVPLADVLEEVRQDLRRRTRFAQRFHARMAGPRSSAAVLAALPVFGVLLGEVTGSGPVGVLTSTVVGQVLLMAGAALICGGLRWSARLTRQVVA